VEFEVSNFTFQPEFHVNFLLPDKFIIEEDDPMAYAILLLLDEALDEAFCN